MKDDKEPTPTDVGELPAVMTVDQVAAYLQLSKRTVYNMAAGGELPAAKVGDQWRFYRPELDRWLVKLSRENVGDLTLDDQAGDQAGDHVVEEGPRVNGKV